MSAISNDLGYQQSFAFQLSCFGKPSDLLIAVSSSGNSPNIIKAIEVAKELDMHVIAFTGFDGGIAGKLADINLHVSSDNYGVVEDCHQILMHTIAQHVRLTHSNPETLDTIQL